jgi:hypothetical protein
MAIVHRVGRRGAALLFFAFLDAIYCHGLLFPPAAVRASPTYVWLASIAPLWGWAAMWGGVGAACLVFAFRRRDQPAYAAAMALKILWAGVNLGGWLWAGLDRAYLAAAIWVGFAGLLAVLSGWPETGGGAWTRPSR